MPRLRTNHQAASSTVVDAAARRDRTLGQSLVEFALVLPIILMLTLIALDFGRVYLGYINIQNVARIGANFAANNPTAWGATPDAAVQTKYRNQILADTTATNCRLPKVAGVAQVPTPTFTDTNANGVHDVGDTVAVHVNCTFDVITPVIANMVGGQVAVSAASTFPVKTGITGFAGSGGGGGTAPNAAFTANGVISGPAVSISGVAPFDVDFRDTSGGTPTSWSWSLAPGVTTTAQDPLVYTYTTAGSYVVTMTATNLQGSSNATLTVNVAASSTVDFTASATSGTAPLTVTFTDASTPGGTAWDWTFGAGQGTGTGTPVNHTYATAGTYTVALTVTYPSPTGPITATKVGYISVGVPLCVVPSLNNQRINTEQSTSGKWYLAGFSVANLSVGPGSPNGNGNWKIAAQTLTANSSVPCTATIQVNDH
jgi:PKD repeat protein